MRWPKRCGTLFRLNYWGYNYMSHILIAITGGIYLFVACDQLAKGNNAMAITWFAYALANVGLWLAAK